MKITLNPQGVLIPALEAMQNTCEIMSISLSALADADLDNIPAIPDTFFSFRLENAAKSADERRTSYANWLLSKGFQDLANGVRKSLEEAFLYVEVLKLQGTKVPEEGLEGFFNEIRRRANQQNFPTLLAAVNVALREPIQFEQEFLSLQKVRNCLEHRHGVVGTTDVNYDGQSLRLVLPRLKVFVERGGVEFDAAPGMFIDKGEEIVIQRGHRERIFPLGDRISFNAGEFEEIASACWFFGSDLAGKLPKL